MKYNQELKKHEGDKLKKYKRFETLSKKAEDKKQFGVAVNAEYRSGQMAGMFVDKKEKQRRLDICKSCNFYRNFLMLKYPKWDRGARCAKCTCFLDAKAALTKEFFGKCPIDKW